MPEDLPGRPACDRRLRGVPLHVCTWNVFHGNAVPPERRVCQAVRVADVGLVGNVHVTGGLVADEQFLRAAAFVDALAEPGEPVILAGDANIVPGRGDTYGELDEWGFSRPLARATVEAFAEQAERDLREGRSGKAYFERVLALREEARQGFADVLGVE